MVDSRGKSTRERLERCWEVDINWDLYPCYLKEGCHQIGRSLSLPPTAVLSSFIALTSHIMSPAVINITELNWSEPALIWMSINMPTGSGKSSLYKYVYNITCEVRRRALRTENEPMWLVGDATFEKMGDLMSQNYGCLFGLYDELSTFLTQLNLYRGKGLAVSHELALFLQLYNGSSWSHQTVTGDSNFTMEKTNLVVAGFSQPSVSRNLIEFAGNTEKGLSQRFLWIFPKPSYAHFSTLEAIDELFTEKIVSLLTSKWDRSTEPKVFLVSHNSPTFSQKFDELQDKLHTLAARDDLLTGMLSKAKGQILRVAASLQLLFAIDDDNILSESRAVHISEDCIKAGIDFVDVCCQHTSFMAGRGVIAEEISFFISDPENTVECTGSNAAAFCLKLPGKNLYLTPLLKAKKFRSFGYKTGALSAFNELQSADLGCLEEIGAGKGLRTQYKFVKTEIPEDDEGRKLLSTKLRNYGVSFLEYKQAMALSEILPTDVQESRGMPSVSKRCTESPKQSTPKKSTPKSTPRKSTPSKHMQESMSMPASKRSCTDTPTESPIPKK